MTDLRHDFARGVLYGREIDYWIARGEKMRAEALANLFRALGRRLAALPRALSARGRAGYRDMARIARVVDEDLFHRAANDADAPRARLRHG